MSMVKDLEATKEQLAKALAELEGERKARESDSKSATDAAAVMEDKIKAAEDKIAEITAALQGEQAKTLELNAALAARQAELDATKDKLAKAERQLENPAFKDASAPGQKEPVKDGVDAPDGSTSQTPTWDEYNKITEPGKRTDFWNKNEAKLKQEMAAVHNRR